jgi:AhpD family alkylhydroperoxidase
VSSFSQLNAEAFKDGALSTKTKILMAVALAAGLKCEFCTRFHVSKAVEAGASRAEILEAAGVSMMMAGGPAATYAAVVLLEVLDELSVK